MSQSFKLTTPVIFRASLFAFLLSLPGVSAYVFGDGASWRVFNDWDEAFYFPMTRDMGKLSPFEIYRYQKPPPYWNASWGISLPHYLTVGLLGRVMNGAEISVPLAAISLDFICALLAYILLSRFFQLISNERIGEVAACGMLLTPWIYPFTANFPEWIWSGITFNNRSHYVCLPVMRGVSTQLSYIFLPICFLLSLPSQVHVSRAACLLGAFTGLLIYVYIFSWVAVSLTLGLTLLLRTANRPGEPKTKLWKDVIGYTIGNLLVALWGIIWVRERMQGGVLDVTHASLWVLPLETIAILLILALIRFVRTWTVPETYLLSALFSELLLSNSQHFTNAVTVDYHMLSLYLHPIITGCLFTYLLLLINRRTFVSLLLLLFFTLAAGMSGIRNQRYVAALHSNYEMDFRELIRYLKTSTHPSDPLLVIGWPEPFQHHWTGRPVNILQPYWINALSSRDTFLSGPGSPGTVAEKELYTAFLFTGKLQAVGSCPPDDSTVTDSLWQYANTDRRSTCSSIAEGIRTLDFCELLSKAKTEYVLFESEYGITPPASLGDLLLPVWDSKYSHFKVMRFDQSNAQMRYCKLSETQAVTRQGHE